MISCVDGQRSGSKII